MKVDIEDEDDDRDEDGDSTSGHLDYIDFMRWTGVEVLLSFGLTARDLKV